jgi:microsomal dipeptidase-like Zn-dependent dipeptidase
MDANYLPVMTTYREFDELHDALDSHGMSRHEIDLILGTNALNLIRRVCD